MLPANNNTPATPEERQGIQTNILQSIVAPLNHINKTLTNLVSFITIEKNRQELAAEEAKSEARGKGGGSNNSVNDYLEREQSRIDRLISAVASIGAPIILGIYQFVKHISDQIPGMLRRAADFFIHLGQTIIDVVGPPIREALTKVTEIFGPVFEPIFNMVKIFVSEMVLAGQQLTHALLDFIGNHLSGRAREIFDSIRNFSIARAARNTQATLSRMTGGIIPPPAPASGGGGGVSSGGGSVSGGSVSTGSRPSTYSGSVRTGPSTAALPPGVHARQIDRRPEQNVVDAIRQAASRVGVDFGIMMAMARQESGFNASAAARTSSARGLFQFLRGTWNGIVRQYGRQFPEINANSIMNPLASALAGALYIRDNINLLRRAGLPVHSGSVYTLHFMGGGGGISLLRAADRTPDAIAASVFPAAARANRNIFYDHTTHQARTLRETRDFIYGLIMPYEDSYRNAYAIGTATAAAGTGALAGNVQPRPPQTPAGPLPAHPAAPTNNRPPTVSGADHTAVRDQYIHRLGGH